MKVQIKLTYHPGTEHSSYVMSQPKNTTADEVEDVKMAFFDALSDGNTVMQLELEKGKTLFVGPEMMKSCTVEVIAFDE